MSKIAILWSISPIMTILALIACLLCGFVYFLCLHGLLWEGGEDVLICEEG